MEWAASTLQTTSEHGVSCDVNTGRSKMIANIKGVRAKSGIRNER
jgi:hypothetical protein